MDRRRFLAGSAAALAARPARSDGTVNAGRTVRVGMGQTEAFRAIDVPLAG